MRKNVFNDLSAYGQCVGIDYVDAWICTGIPTTYPWDTSKAKCTKNGQRITECVPGPFGPDGHLEYGSTTCDDGIWGRMSENEE